MPLRSTLQPSSGCGDVANVFGTHPTSDFDPERTSPLLFYGNLRLLNGQKPLGIGQNNGCSESTTRSFA
jgi:hypothetical protein